MSGLNRVEAEEVLEELFQDWQTKEIRLEVSREEGPSSQEGMRVSDLGFVYDLEQTLDQMFAQSSLRSEVLSAPHAAAPRGLKPVVHMNQHVLDRVLDHVVAYGEAPQEAQVVLEEETGQWELQEHQIGYGISADFQLSLADQIRAFALEGNPQPVLDVSLDQVSPKVKTMDVEGLYHQVELFLEKSVSWMVDEHEVVFSLRDYPWMIEVDQEEDFAWVSETALVNYVQEWAEMFDVEPSEVLAGEPVEQERGYLKAPFEGVFREGRVLDQDNLIQQLLGALQGEEQHVVIELVYEEQSPIVKTLFGEELTMISQGRTSYRLGNGEDRVYNVQFGLGKYDGVVIPQGAEFSFNQVLGWVTYQDGWKPALAIFGGGGVRKVPGGGLCQVSTTVYRASVNGGLPITKRKPHSLDISYYHEYGYGIDATIYPPAGVDLKFVNDTPGPIVIHSYVDPFLEEAFVEFYGIDDGREIELEQTIIRDVILPRKTTQTDELPAGTQEVLHPGRIGRYIEWDWKVKRADGTVEDRVIETLYPAEPKQVLVGTGI